MTVLAIATLTCTSGVKTYDDELVTAPLTMDDIASFRAKSRELKDTSFCVVVVVSPHTPLFTLASSFSDGPHHDSDFM